MCTVNKLVLEVVRRYVYIYSSHFLNGFEDQPHTQLMYNIYILDFYRTMSPFLDPFSEDPRSSAVVAAVRPNNRLACHIQLPG